MLRGNFLQVSKEGSCTPEEAAAAAADDDDDKVDEVDETG